jgi:hypothetical protein
MKNEFKGGNEYQQEVLADVQRDLTRAIKLLNSINHDFAFVDECELEYAVVKSCTEMLSEVSQNLYAVPK